MQTKATYVKDLTVDEFKTLIWETVEAVLEELLPDPDEGKSLKPEVKQQLLEIRERREAGEPGIPLEEVMREFEIDH